MMTSDCNMDDEVPRDGDDIDDSHYLPNNDAADDNDNPTLRRQVVVVGVADAAEDDDDQRGYESSPSPSSLMNHHTSNDHDAPSSVLQPPQSIPATCTSDENYYAAVPQRVMELELELLEPNDNDNGDDDNNDNNNHNNHIDPSFQQHAMELNVALEALEAMRRANLAVEFSNAAPSFHLRHDKCTYCQREALHKFLSKPKDVTKSGSVNNSMSSSSSMKLDGSRIRRFNSSVGSYFYSSKTATAAASATTQSSYQPPSASQSNSSLSTMDDGITKSATDGVGGSMLGSSTSSSSTTSMLKKVYYPCLTCGHPTCATHSSSSLSKNRVTICQSCACLYELEYLVETVASTTAPTTSNYPAECQQKVNDMIDCYDRAKLLLEYAAEYAEEIACALESNTARSNKIGVGSSASGIVSGVTGVIGCGALFFPPVAVAGVPLLIASLVFGTGATTVSTGDAAVRQYFSEPNRLANKMFALQGMVVSLSRITDVLRIGLSIDSPLAVSCSRDDTNEFDDDKKEERKSPQNGSVGKKDDGVIPTSSAKLLAATSKSPSRSSVVGRSTRYLGRVCTTASSSISFIPIVGGVLSGASIYFEGKELKRTLSKISEGNPCAKAERVRLIKDQLSLLPDSKWIAAECRRLLEQAQR
jgi:hypothetical protein